MSDLLDALHVTRFCGVHFDFIALVYEWRDGDDQAGLQSGRLAHRAGRCLLQRRLGADYFQLHGILEIDSDGLVLEKFHLHHGVGNQVVHRFAQLLARQMHLLVVLRVHEMEIVALAVEILEFHFVKDGAVHKFFRAKSIIDDRAALEIFHARLHGAALIARSAMVHAENREKLALVLDDHAGTKLCGFDAAHDYVCDRGLLIRPTGRHLPGNWFRKFRPAARLRAAACGMTRGAPETAAVPARSNKYKGAGSRGSIVASAICQAPLPNRYK